MNQTFKKQLEILFEGMLWKGRLITLMAVVFSFLSSLTLFLAGSKRILSTVIKTVQYPTQDIDFNILLINIIGAVDLYLIAIVLLILSFGIYELFVSKIDQGRHQREINILEIKSLDDLKSRLLKVIIMALVIYFFKAILATHFNTPLEMLYLGIAILSAAGSSIFISKIE